MQINCSKILLNNTLLAIHMTWKICDKENDFKICNDLGGHWLDIGQSVAVTDIVLSAGRSDTLSFLKYYFIFKGLTYE